MVALVWVHAWVLARRKLSDNWFYKIMGFQFVCSEFSFFLICNTLVRFGDFVLVFFSII
jgi:hypothetical protein